MHILTTEKNLPQERFVAEGLQPEDISEIEDMLQQGKEELNELVRKQNGLLHEVQIHEGRQKGQLDRVATSARLILRQIDAGINYNRQARSTQDLSDNGRVLTERIRKTLEGIEAAQREEVQAEQAAQSTIESLGRDDGKSPFTKSEDDEMKRAADNCRKYMAAIEAGERVHIDDLQRFLSNIVEMSTSRNKGGLATKIGDWSSRELQNLYRLAAQ